MLEKVNDKIKRLRAKRSNPRYWFSYYFFPLSQDDKLLKVFKNKHKGERCFIIGNGPSLNKIDLTLLENEVTFGMNAIYLNYEKMGFYPTYYAVEDVFVAEDRADEINSYNQSIKFLPNYLKYCLKRDEQTIFYNFIAPKQNTTEFTKNAALKVFFGGTVSFVCMQLAYYMGFEKVYLIGFDHNYVIPDTAKVKGTEILSTTDDLNHFSAEYFGKGKRWHDPDFPRMESSYKKARNSFEEDGRKIYNATFGGKLEVFERVHFLELF